MPFCVYLRSWVDGAEKEKKERSSSFVLCVFDVVLKTCSVEIMPPEYTKSSLFPKKPDLQSFSLASLEKWCVHSSELKPQALYSDNICLCWYVFHALNKQPLWSPSLPRSLCQQTYLSPTGTKAYFFNYPPETTSKTYNLQGIDWSHGSLFSPLCISRIDRTAQSPQISGFHLQLKQTEMQKPPHWLFQTWSANAFPG